MDRLTLFEEALRAVTKLTADQPDLATARSIANQLRYLIDLQTGVSGDRSRLSEIIIGIQTIRDIEPSDEAAAQILFRVEEEVSQMRTGR